MHILLPLIIISTTIAALITYVINQYIEIATWASVIIFVCSLIPGAQISRIIQLTFYDWNGYRKLGKSRAEVEYIVRNYKPEYWKKHLEG